MSINRPVSYVKHCHDDIVGKKCCNDRDNEKGYNGE